MASPSLSRPYDIAIPAPALQKIMARRHSPDGIQREFVPNPRLTRYPWDRMELGDFFLVPLADRSLASLRTAFYQAAARLDMEISIATITTPNLGKCVRVTATIFGVSNYRRALDTLLDEDEALPPAAQKYSDIPRPKYSDLAARNLRRRVYSRPKTRTPAPTIPTNPFWADADPELPKPFSGMEPPPEIKLSREEVIRRAMGQTP